VFITIQVDRLKAVRHCVTVHGYQLSEIRGNFNFEVLSTS